MCRVVVIKFQEVVMMCYQLIIYAKIVGNPTKHAKNSKNVKPEPITVA